MNLPFCSTVLQLNVRYENGALAPCNLPIIGNLSVYQAAKVLAGYPLPTVACCDSGGAIAPKATPAKH